MSRGWALLCVLVGLLVLMVMAQEADHRECLAREGAWVVVDTIYGFVKVPIKTPKYGCIGARVQPYRLP